MNDNSIAPYSDVSLKDLAEAAGIARFFGEDNWSLTISGILIQGGVTTPVGVNGNLAVPFNVGFNQRCMQVLLTARTSAAYAAAIPSGLSGFNLRNGPVSSAYQWVAFGT